MGSSQADVIASIEAEMNAALSSAATGQAREPDGDRFALQSAPSTVDGGGLPFDLAAEVQALNDSSKEFDGEGSVASLGDFMTHASLVQPDSLAGFPSFKTLCPAGKGLHRAPGGGDGAAGGGSGSSGGGGGGRVSSGRGSGSGSGSGWSASDGSDVTSPSPKAARIGRKMERTRGPAGVVPTTRITGGVARSTLFGGAGGGAPGGVIDGLPVTVVGADTTAPAHAPAVNALDWGDEGGDGGDARFSSEALDLSSQGDASSPSTKSSSSPSSFGSSARRGKVLAKLLRPFKKGDGGGGGRGSHVPSGGSGKDDVLKPPSL